MFRESVSHAHTLTQQSDAKRCVFCDDKVSLSVLLFCQKYFHRNTAKGIGGGGGVCGGGAEKGSFSTTAIKLTNDQGV